MDELKRIYRQAMPERIRAIEGALAQLHADTAAATALRRVAHSLRGSGATYGFKDVSAAAAAVEDAADAELRDRAESLLAVLRAVAAGDTSSRILAVDDDPEIQLLLRYVLARPGRELVLAASAAEARAALASGTFRLVLLDLVLPDADGRTLLAELRGRADRICVLSGRASDAVRRECAALGAHAFIEKPFDPEVLAAEVGALLGEQAAS